MTTVFIGGSRKIGRLNEAVRRRLVTIVEKNIPVLVGDANGADKAVQAFFLEVGYENLTVFCTGNTCRNNLRGWPTEHVQPEKGAPERKSREFFTIKDRAMSSKATHGLMLWDGESLGTLVNVVRLQRANKTSVVYVQPSRSFVDVRSNADLAKLTVSQPELISRAKESVELEGKNSIVAKAASLSLF
jgi:hypothetical protein